MKEPDPILTDYLFARREYEAAQTRLSEISERLMKQMEADQRKTYRWAADGASHTLTYVQSHTTEIDEVGLRKALRAKVFDRYTKRVLDRKAMEKAMDAGEVDPVTVSRFVHLRPKVPYLQFKVRPEGAE